MCGGRRGRRYRRGKRGKREEVGAGRNVLKTARKRNGVGKEEENIDGVTDSSRSIDR